MNGTLFVIVFFLSDLLLNLKANSMIDRYQIYSEFPFHLSPFYSGSGELKQVSDRESKVPKMMP
jgi:hypothetical protein